MGFKLAEAFVVLRADSRGLSTNLRKVRGQLEGISTSSLAVGSSLKKLFAISAAGVGAALVKFANFEKGMLRVKALSQATEGEFSALTDKARELGRTTEFTAVQVTDAMGAFALQGFKANAILGSLGHTLNIATASGLQLGQATEIISGVMKGMSLEVKDLGRVTDVLTAGFTTSATTLPELGRAIKRIGPLAKAASRPIEEVVAVLKAFANVQIRGEEAGTALRNIFIRLQKPPREAVAEFEKFKLSIQDLDGKLRPIADIVDDLNKAMEGYTDTQKAASLANIAGVRAFVSFQQILNIGGDEIRKYEGELRNVGGLTKRMAELMRSSMVVEFKVMISAMVDFGISVGKILAPAARGVVSIFTAVFKNLNFFSEGFRGSMNQIGSFLDLVAAGLNNWQDTFDIAFLEVSKSMVDFVAEAEVIIGKNLPEIFAHVGQVIKNTVLNAVDDVKTLVSTVKGVSDYSALQTKVDVAVAAGDFKKARRLQQDVVDFNKNNNLQNDVRGKKRLETGPLTLTAVDRTETAKAKALIDEKIAKIMTDSLARHNEEANKKAAEEIKRLLLEKVAIPTPEAVQAGAAVGAGIEEEGKKKPQFLGIEELSKSILKAGAKKEDIPKKQLDEAKKAVKQQRDMLALEQRQIQLLTEMAQGLTDSGSVVSQ